MDQIGTTLELIRDKLNQFLANIYATQDDAVIISNIMQDDGGVYEEAKNKMVMFLANITHETTIGTYNKNKPTGENTYSTVSPPLYINLYLLFYANYSDAHYRSGISMVSDTISFFQNTPVFTQDNLPGLDPVIDKLTFNMVNLEVVDVNHLLGMIGAKYLPSVYYKIRLIPYVSTETQGETPGVQGLQNEGEPRDVRPPRFGAEIGDDDE